MILDEFKDLEGAMAFLLKHHYHYTFQCTHQGWRCLETQQEYTPEEMVLLGCQRFQQKRGTARAMTFLYAVSTPDGKKGVILDNCHTYANPHLGDFLVRMKLQYLQPEATRKKVLEAAL
ncbi:hypothetical protein [Rufibacter radiotolerans]|nr:hypothetical protein [Rufibacter radiotolerans]